MTTDTAVRVTRLVVQGKSVLSGQVFLESRLTLP